MGDDRKANSFAAFLDDAENKHTFEDLLYEAAIFRKDWGLRLSVLDAARAYVHVRYSGAEKLSSIVESLQVLIEDVRADEREKAFSNAVARASVQELAAALADRVDVSLAGVHERLDRIEACMVHGKPLQPATKKARRSRK